MISRLIIVASLLLSTNGYAGDMFDVLKRMSEADQNQNYQGTFILRKSDSLSTMRVAHGVNEEGIWESLESLNGEQRKVVRRNSRIISIYPDRELVTFRNSDKKQSLHQQLPENIDQLESYYFMNRLEDDRIANHKTLVVELLPNDQYRYGYRYWIDKNTGMLLRCDLMSAVLENTTGDAKSRVVEQMMFTSLEYLSSSPDQEFELQDISKYTQKSLNEPEVDVAKSSNMRWQVKRLPKGFMLTQSTMRHSKAITDTTLDANRPDLMHMVYSDGLASVSVFIEKNQGADEHMKGASAMGAVNAYGNVVGEYFVTVVGEVPVKTVQLIAQSTTQLK